MRRHLRPVIVMAFALVAVLGLRGAAHAQVSSQPGVDCSLLTPAQAAGLPCVTVAPPPVVVTGPPLLAADDDCPERPNPYIGDGAEALRCILRREVARLPLPSEYAPGQLWRGVGPRPYAPPLVGGPYVMAVVAVTRGLTGETVVTGQWVEHPETPGAPLAFRVGLDEPMLWRRER